MDPKVIIVVLGAEGHYKPLIQSVRNTWGALPPYKTVYCYGWMEGRPHTPEGSVMQFGDEIMCGLSDNLQVVHYKTLMTFEHLLKTEEFDYIFRCCAGSYIHKPAMVKFLQDKPRSRFYCGICGYECGTHYASGSGYFLSRDLVQLAVDHKNEVWPHARTDDAAMGWFMRGQGLQVYPGARRIDIDAPEHMNQLNVVDMSVEYHYHFRHKIDVMNAIHARVTAGTK